MTHQNHIEKLKSYQFYWKIKEQQELDKGDLQQEEIVCTKIIEEALTTYGDQRAEEERGRFIQSLKKELVEIRDQIEEIEGRHSADQLTEFISTLTPPKTTES